MTAEEFLNSLPNLTDGVLQQDYLGQSEFHDTLISAMKLLEEEKQAIRLIDLAFKVSPKLAAKLAGAATSSGQQVVSERFKVLVEERNGYGDNKYSGTDLKISLLSEILAIWAIPDLEKLLQQEYSTYRAAVALTRIATSAGHTTTRETAISALLRGLQNQNKRVRSIVIKQLGLIESDRITEALLSLLKNDNESKIRQLAAQTLLSKTTHFGEFPQSLLNGLQHSSVTVRIESIKFLGSTTTDSLRDLGVDLVVDALITRFLEDNSLTAKRFAANSLGQIGNKKAIAPLISVLQNQSQHCRVRRSTIYALEQIGTEQIFQALIIALKDPVPYVRIDAASALSRIAGDWAIKDLVPSLSDKKCQVRQSSCQALEKIRSIKVEEELLNTLSNFTITPLHRRTIFSLLPKVGDKKSFDTLISLLTYPNKSIRSEAATEIGLFARNRKDIDYINKAVEPLITTLDDRKADVRDSVARALGYIAIHSECIEANQAAIVSVLEVAVKDRNHGVRNSAIDALAKIPRQNAFDYLIKRLDLLDIWTAGQTIEELGRMIHDHTTTKLAKFPLTDAQIDLAMEKLEQASKNPKWLISKPAKKMLAQLKTN